MNPETQALFDNLAQKDDAIRYISFSKLLSLTENKVDWVYAVWQSLVERLNSANSYQRSIALMLLCNLSQSDNEKRMNDLIPEILSHTKDEKFITSRQTLQNIWKIAWFNSSLSETIIDHLKQRFITCENENHANLLRQDILQSLITLAELRHDEALKTDVEKLIETEKEEKNQKAYRALMKGKK